MNSLWSNEKRVADFVIDHNVILCTPVTVNVSLSKPETCQASNINTPHNMFCGFPCFAAVSNKNNVNE